MLCYFLKRNIVIFEIVIFRKSLYIVYQRISNASHQMRVVVDFCLKIEPKIDTLKSMRGWGQGAGGVDESNFYAFPNVISIREDVKNIPLLANQNKSINATGRKVNRYMFFPLMSVRKCNLLTAFTLIHQRFCETFFSYSYFLV